MIKITPAAEKAIEKRLAGKPETLGFRIYVRGYG